MASNFKEGLHEASFVGQETDPGSVGQAAQGIEKSVQAAAQRHEAKETPIVQPAGDSGGAHENRPQNLAHHLSPPARLRPFHGERGGKSSKAIGSTLSRPPAGRGKSHSPGGFLVLMRISCLFWGLPLSW